MECEYVFPFHRSMAKEIDNISKVQCSIISKNKKNSWKCGYRFQTISALIKMHTLKYSKHSRRVCLWIWFPLCSKINSELMIIYDFDYHDSHISSHISENNATNSSSYCELHRHRWWVCVCVSLNLFKFKFDWELIESNNGIFFVQIWMTICQYHLWSLECDLLTFVQRFHSIDYSMRSQTWKKT